MQSRLDVIPTKDHIRKVREASRKLMLSAITIDHYEHFYQWLTTEGVDFCQSEKVYMQKLSGCHSYEDAIYVAEEIKTMLVNDGWLDVRYEFHELNNRPRRLPNEPLNQSDWYFYVTRPPR